MQRGRDLYNFNCYFCHGYNGDAKTAAAEVLDPRPRNFRVEPKPSVELVMQALINGRPGTAMKSFAGRLSDADIADLATFVVETFAACDRDNAVYHSAENGWPNHARNNGAAFPFANGVIPVDADPAGLTAEQREGLALFRSTCIACHEGRHETREPLGFEAAHDEEEGADHADEYAKGGPHDQIPVIHDLTPVELAGRDLYMKACEDCHAADGTGENWVGWFLDPSPPDFNRAARPDAATMARVTREGLAGTSMPAFGAVLSEGEIASIIAWIERAYGPHKNNHAH